ncbi:DUF2892 domain-containing protein [Kiritimatiellaeota bacterium B1221]|nr:DUF2892 domain-containing protein [Kiritimatiellaeota bacterium B1221]
MKIVTKIRIITIFLLMLSWSLGRYSNPAWLWISVIIGVNMLQSAFTGFCPAETFFKAISKSKNSGRI